MKEREVSSHRTPIYRDAGFTFQSIADAESAFAAESQHPQSSPHYIYTRQGNPTVQATEKMLAELEGSKWSALTSSGMAAIDVALSIFQDGPRTGRWMVFSEVYGGTVSYIREIVEKIRGIEVVWFQTRGENFDLAQLERELERSKPSLLLFESVSNPLLIVADAKEIIRLARKHGARVVVDNTFGTPHLWHPLADGADIVIHSATKYLAGSGDLTAGVVSGNDEAILKEKALKYRKFTGCVLSPDEAYRLGTQLATFELRFQRQCENAKKLAHFLDGHEKVSHIRYPGLGTHPTYAEARRLFGEKGSGAMVTFDLKGGRPACDAFVAAIRDCVAFVPSLGDVNSTLLHVSSVFGKEKYPEEGMIRFSTGCEPYEVLCEAFGKALDAVK